MTDDFHPSEDERQMFVDGTAPIERAREIEAHLANCADCAGDVGRLRDIMTRYREAPSDGAVDDLWPSIRSRIEQEKVVPLAGAVGARRPRWLTVRHVAAIATLAAGVMLTVVLLRPSHRISVDPVAVEDTSAVQLVSDSLKSYENEAQALLNRLEVQRAMLRPDAAASMDRDLKVIDQAIAELRQAIQNDPRNPALRQLLASSLRQKIDLLKRVTNAT